MQLDQCCFVVPPANNNLFPSYPCLPKSPDNQGRKVSDTEHFLPRCTNLYLLVYLTDHSVIDRLLPHIKGNVGFVFTKEDLTEVRDMLLANKVSNWVYLVNLSRLFSRCRLGYNAARVVLHCRSPCKH